MMDSVLLFKRRRALKEKLMLWQSSHSAVESKSVIVRTAIVWKATLGWLQTGPALNSGSCRCGDIYSEHLRSFILTVPRVIFTYIYIYIFKNNHHIFKLFVHYIARSSDKHDPCPRAKRLEWIPSSTMWSAKAVWQNTVRLAAACMSKGVFPCFLPKLVFL